LGEKKNVRIPSCELTLLGVIPSSQGASAEQNMSGIPAAQLARVVVPTETTAAHATVSLCPREVILGQLLAVLVQ